MSKQSFTSFQVPQEVDLAQLCGVADANLRYLADKLSLDIKLTDRSIAISGLSSDVAVAQSLIADMIKQLCQGSSPSVESLQFNLGLIRGNESCAHSFKKEPILQCKGGCIAAKTPGQQQYIDAIKSHTITFGLGPAGTGKTYLAMALAVDALKSKRVDRIVLTRPVVEAGESLGFLPGSLEEKIDPYIRPLYDALFSMLEAERIGRMMEEGVIEIAPLAFMRGRTLSDAFVILDEAQNASFDQLKMFVTRLGFNSKMVITGDMSQTDLPSGQSGLLHTRAVLNGIDQIAFCELGQNDVVRNSLVGQIIEAYALFDNKNGSTHA